MSWLSFAKNIGEKVFGSAEEAPQKIEQHIIESNPGIEDLTVRFEEGTVYLSGTAEDAAALEKTALLAGNLEGVEEVDITEVTLKAEPEAKDTTEYYVIESGDTLSAVAKKYYGDANKYQDIFEANKEVIKDPNKIYPGQKIRIPKAA